MEVIEEKYNWNGQLVFRNKNQIDMIIFHHAASEHCTAQDVHQWHLNNGWTGIGYHYFVNKAGQIYRGRPELAVGAHTEGYNTRSIGICAEGNYMIEQMPEEQEEALRELLLEITQRLGIFMIKGHCQCNVTSCPGDRFPLQEMIDMITRKENEREDPQSIADKQSLKIRSWQGWLKSEFGYSLAVDRLWGSETQRYSVMAWQQLIGARPDGMMGPETKSRTPVLGRGDQSVMVKWLQGYIAAKFGYVDVNMDGIYGELTERAVKTYQRESKLLVDGMAGPLTICMMLS